MWLVGLPQFPLQGIYLYPLIFIQYHTEVKTVHRPTKKAGSRIVAYSVKRSDVTRWKQSYIRPPSPYFILWNAVTHSVKTRLYNAPPPYFIVLASSVKTKEVMVIEFHRIVDLLEIILSEFMWGGA